MIAEIRCSYCDKIGTNLFEVLEIPISDSVKNCDCECLLTDAANRWFYTTSKKIFLNFWRGRSNIDDTERAYELYLETVDFNTDL